MTTSADVERAEDPPDWSECRKLAQQLRAAPRGRRVLALTRPRQMHGLLRSRLPLAALLYLASVEGRLIRQGEAFAVLDLPGNAREELPRDTPIKRLDRLDRYWEVLTFGLPPALLLLAALVVALVVPPPLMLPVALALVLAALLWVSGLMTAFIVGQSYCAWRAAERIRNPVQLAAGPLLGQFWSVPICHCPDPAALPDLLLAAHQRAAKLTAKLPTWQRKQLPGWPALLVLRDGCSTDQADQAASDIDGGLVLTETSPRLLLFGNADLELAKRKPSNSPRGISLLLLSAPLAILLSGVLVADRERQACASGCPNGGLTRYGQAVAWMVNQLFLRGDSPGLNPARFDTRILGWCLNVLGPVLAVCVVVAVTRYLAFQRRGVDSVLDLVIDDLAGKRPTIGIVTAVPEELVAVRELLEKPQRAQPGGDFSRYTRGQIPSADPLRPHHVVVTSMVEGGNDRAAAAVAHLVRSFGTVNSVIMCGIAAGIPSPDHPTAHVRLGDIVIGTWEIVDFDHVDEKITGPERRGGMPLPSSILKIPTNELRAKELTGERPWERWLDVSARPTLARYTRPADDTDVLYAGDQSDEIVPHPDRAASEHRAGWPKVHYGRIGSSDRSLRNAKVRDRIAAEHGVLALEMDGKGAGIAAELSGVEWLVVRGISDYGDNHVDPAWRYYPALAAAAYVRALLEELPPRGPRGGHVLTLPDPRPE